MAQHEILLTTLMEQQTVTNSAVIHGLCTMTLNQQCIARSGSPPMMINHLTSILILQFQFYSSWLALFIISPLHGFNYHQLTPVRP